MTLEKENEKLKEENERLRNYIRRLNQELESYRNYGTRQFYSDYDYLPYEDDDRDR